MSRAEELANKTGALCEKLRRTPMPIADVVPHMQAMADELRRLAQVEAEHEALKKAISDAEPVAQIRMSDGGLSVVNRVTTKGVQVSVHRADGDWTPLYTLNGIKKP